MQFFLEVLDSWMSVSPVIYLCGAVILCIILLYQEILSLHRDLSKLSDSLRVLIRSGRSPESIRFKSSVIEGVWRRIVSYNAGILKERDSQNDISQILASGRGIVESSLEDDKILNVLCDVLLKSASPEAIFVAVAIKNAKGWELVSTSGVSKARLSDPFIIVSDKLPLDYRDTVYTQASNGLEFDFRAIGVGLSLFVPLKTDSGDVIGVVWMGFSEHSGAIPEGRKHTIELIAQHASASYVKSRERNKNRRVDEQKKEEMLSLSHDMKAPGTRALYAVRELDSILEARGLNDEKSLAQEIEYALVEQGALIDKLFNVDSNLSEQKAAPHLEIDVGAVVKSRVNAFRIIAKSVGLELKAVELVRAKARFSKDTLERILDNLISNSIKYSASGCIEVVLDGSGSTLRIDVRDHGIGVDEEIRKYLFSSRIRSAKEVSRQGHRYGLTVVKTLVEEMGGSVGFLPNIPSGSVFFIEVPASKIVPIQDAASSAMQVLVVDDDPLVRATHERWLASLGIRVYGVSTFKEAIDHIVIKKPDYVLTDYQLPGEEIVRFLDLLPQDLEVIVVSGRNQSSIRKQLSAYGNVKAILEKPISKSQLRDLLFSVEDGVIGNLLARKIA